MASNPAFANAFPLMEEEAQDPKPEAAEQPPAASLEPAATTGPSIPQSLLDKAVEETLGSDATMRHAMADMQVQEAQFRFDQRLSALFAQSGAFADLKGKSVSEAIALAATKILLGRGMGMQAAEAINALEMVKVRKLLWPTGTLKLNTGQVPVQLDIE